MKTINYFRVSTQRQGASGLGIEAQRAAVAAYCSTVGCNVMAEYTEVETGKRNDRPELVKALHHAKITNSTLVIAKLDRLSRNAAFLLMLRDSGVKFVCADMPNANDLTIGILALVAQEEREAISKRTKDALQALKARGVKLGNPNGAAALARARKGNSASLEVIKSKANAFADDLRPVMDDIRSAGATSLAQIAVALNDRGIETPRGGKWAPQTVSNLLRRLEVTTQSN